MTTYEVRTVQLEELTPRDEEWGLYGKWKLIDTASAGSIADSTGPDEPADLTTIDRQLKADGHLQGIEYWSYTWLDSQTIEVSQHNKPLLHLVIMEDEAEHNADCPAVDGGGCHCDELNERDRVITTNVVSVKFIEAEACKFMSGRPALGHYEKEPSIAAPGFRNLLVYRKEIMYVTESRGVKAQKRYG